MIEYTNECALLPLLGSASLQSLCICQEDGGTLLHSSPLIQGAPFIHTLEISWDANEVDIPIVEMLLGFKRLRSLVFRHQSTPSELCRLGSSPTLECLVVWITGFVGSCVAVELPTIRELKLQGDSENISALAATLRAPSLIHLAVDMIAGTFIPSIVQSVQSICTSSISAGLRSLSLKFTGTSLIMSSNAGRPAAVISLSSILKPSFAMDQLESLEVDAPQCYVDRVLRIITSDGDLEVVACGLKILQSISLSGVIFLPEPLSQHSHGGFLASVVENPPNIPVTILRHFASHCPNLVSLSLDRVHLCTSPEELSTCLRGHHEAALRGHPMRNLNLGRVTDYTSLDEITGNPNINHKAVGQYLDSLFPNLDVPWMQYNYTPRRSPEEAAAIEKEDGYMRGPLLNGLMGLAGLSILGWQGRSFSMWPGDDPCDKLWGEVLAEIAARQLRRSDISGPVLEGGSVEQT